MENKANLIYKLVSRIPAGKVATYGRIARLTGVNSPRLVGRILHQNPDPDKIPCHRVVNSRGQLARNFAFGGYREQWRMLQLEGVPFKNGKVDLKISGNELSAIL